jgi:DNA-binding NarL/FixJ family response regulator
MGQVERATLGAIQVSVAALSSANVFDNIEPVLAALMVAMGADLAGYYLHDALGLSWPVVILPSDAARALPEPLRAAQPTAVGARMHPGWQHCLRHRAGPFAVSDIISDRTWRNTEAAALMRPHWGRQYQFAIPIYSPTTPTMFAAWVFARSGRDFTARHREVAYLVRPVLAQVTRHHTAALEAGAHPRGPTPALTDREQVILRLLARGRTAPEIGRRLDISPRTVHKHVEHLYRKLDVHDRRAVLERAHLLGVLDGEGDRFPGGSTRDVQSEAPRLLAAGGASG